MSIGVKRTFRCLNATKIHKAKAKVLLGCCMTGRNVREGHWNSCRKQKPALSLTLACEYFTISFDRPRLRQLVS